VDFLSLLFPKKCIGCRRIGSYICSTCFAFIDSSPQLICAECSKFAINGLTHPVCRKKYSIDGVFSAVAYKGIMKKILYQYKFEPYVFDLSRTLSEIVYEGLLEYEPLSYLSKEKVVLVPIPLSEKKKKTRGYNQSLLLVKNLSELSGYTYSDILIRQKKTLPQYALSKEKRRENIKGAFALQDVSYFENVLLVDDIMTSGATLSEASYVLKKAGVKKVFGVTVAHG